jgi:hypothetical protein
MLNDLNRSPMVWPSLVCHFKSLERFSLCVHHSKTNVERLTIQLSALSPNLRKLTLQAPFAIEAFNDYVKADPSVFPQLEALTLASTSSKASLEVPIPSTVTELRLGTHTNSVTSLPLLLLPTGLITLQSHVDDFIVSDKCKKFPLELKELVLALSTPPACLFAALPRSCTKVALRVSPSSSPFQPISEQEWEALSQLELSSLSTITPPSFSAEHALKLPRTLEYLHLRMTPRPSRIKEDWRLSILAAMPQTLKSLSGIWDHRITVALAQAMPRSLAMSFQQTIDLEAIPYLPVNTKTLHLPRHADLALIRSLPAGLENLYAPGLSKSIADSIPHTLRMFFLNSEVTFTAEMLQMLPRNLQHLGSDHTCLYPIDDWESLKALPPRLASLSLLTECTEENIEEIEPSPIPAQSSRWLPRTLNSLSLGCLDIPASEFCEWATGLPTRLTSLQLLLQTLPSAASAVLCFSPVLLILEITVLESPEGGWSQFLTNLPEQLELLKFSDHGQSKPSDIVTETFKFMPKSIVYLILPKSPKVDKRCLEYLPNLHSLSLGFNETPLWFIRS